MNRAALALSGLALLLAWSLLPAPTTEFTFPTRDGRGTTTYRCALLESLAAHASLCPSAEVAAEPEHLLAVSEVTTRALHAEVQGQFGCQHRGST